MTGPKLAPAAPDWDQAACLDVEPELFFTDEEEAIKVCKGCPIKDDCLRFALETRQDHGVWGGLTEQQRARTPQGARQARAVTARHRGPRQGSPPCQGEAMPAMCRSCPPRTPVAPPGPSQRMTTHHHEETMMRVPASPDATTPEPVRITDSGAVEYVSLAELQVTAVRRVHRRVEVSEDWGTEFECGHCCTIDGDPAPWPCVTVKALDGARL